MFQEIRKACWNRILFRFWILFSSGASAQKAHISAAISVNYLIKQQKYLKYIDIWPIIFATKTNAYPKSILRAVQCIAVYPIEIWPKVKWKFHWNEFFKNSPKWIRKPKEFSSGGRPIYESQADNPKQLEFLNRIPTRNFETNLKKLVLKRNLFLYFLENFFNVYWITFLKFLSLCR